MSIPQSSAFNASHGFATQYAIDGLKALTLAQGGAVVAILSFAGNAGQDRVDAAIVADSLTFFILGLAGALGAFLTTYTAQSFASHGKRKQTGFFEVLGYLLVAGSLALFLLGGFAAQSGLKSVAPDAPEMVATCELEGVRLYQNPATRDERVGEFIITCMRAKSYGFTVNDTPCATSANVRDPACYRTTRQSHGR